MSKEVELKKDIHPEDEDTNLLGFFALLLKVDKRVNPHLYVKDIQTENQEGGKLSLDNSEHRH